MNDAQKKLLSTALKQLDLLKCTYAIIDPDGTTHGTLSVSTKKPRKKHEHVYSFKQYGYTDVCDAMVPGDTYVFSDCAGRPYEEVKNYRSAICAKLGARIPGRFKSVVLPDGSIEVRVF